MKKKMVALLMCTAMLTMSACGQKETVQMKADSVKGAVGKAVAEEAIDGFKEGAGIAEDAVKNEEPVADETEVEVAEPVEEEVLEEPDLSEENVAKMLEEDPYGFVDENAFPRVTWEAQSQNKCKEYGIWSLSCYDVDQFLDDEGTAVWASSFDALEWSEFSGRFSFPAITTCSMFEGLVASSVTDASMWLNVVRDDDTMLSITIEPGLQGYNTRADMVGYSSESNSAEVWYSTNTDVGETNVYKCSLTYSFGEDEDNMEEETTLTYVYRLGNFTVSVNTGRDELTQEQMDEIISHLTYVGHPNDSMIQPRGGASDDANDGEASAADELTVEPEEELVEE